ncbi:hypothetical protein UQW22_10925 [Isoptericola halotolerans]|uniref:hypothetical protein n=1 Tax=Isoptericola halotolerans TaxID=300560 RepID=UPI0038901268
MASRGEVARGDVPQRVAADDDGLVRGVDLVRRPLDLAEDGVVLPVRSVVRSLVGRAGGRLGGLSAGRPVAVLVLGGRRGPVRQVGVRRGRMLGRRVLRGALPAELEDGGGVGVRSGPVVGEGGGRRQGQACTDAGADRTAGEPAYDGGRPAAHDRLRRATGPSPAYRDDADERGDRPHQGPGRGAEADDEDRQLDPRVDPEHRRGLARGGDRVDPEREQRRGARGHQEHREQSQDAAQRPGGAVTCPAGGRRPVVHLATFRRISVDHAV